MACHNCGKSVEIVPAGVSRTKKDEHGNPKAYDAFYVCGHCNYQGNPTMTAQPQKPSAALVKIEQMSEQLALLIEMAHAIEKKVDFLTDKP